MLFGFSRLTSLIFWTLDWNRTGLDSVPVVDKMQRRDIIFKPPLHSALRLNNKSHRIMDTPVQCCSGADRPPFHDLSRTEGQEDDLELQVKLSVRPPSHKDKIEPVRDFAFTSHCTSTSLVNAPPFEKQTTYLIRVLFYSILLPFFCLPEMNCIAEEVSSYSNIDRRSSNCDWAAVTFDALASFSWHLANVCWSFSSTFLN